MSKFKVRDASPSLWAAPVPRMCTRARPLSVPAPHAHVQSLCPLELLQPWQTAAEWLSRAAVSPRVLTGPAVRRRRRFRRRRRRRFSASAAAYRRRHLVDSATCGLKSAMQVTAALPYNICLEVVEGKAGARGRGPVGHPTCCVAVYHCRCLARWVRARRTVEAPCVRELDHEGAERLGAMV